MGSAVTFGRESPPVPGNLEPSGSFGSGRSPRRITIPRFQVEDLFEPVQDFGRRRHLALLVFGKGLAGDPAVDFPGKVLETQTGDFPGDLQPRRHEQGFFFHFLSAYFPARRLTIYAFSSVCQPLFLMSCPRSKCERPDHRPPAGEPHDPHIRNLFSGGRVKPRRPPLKALRLRKSRRAVLKQPLIPAFPFFLVFAVPLSGKFFEKSPGRRRHIQPLEPPVKSRTGLPVFSFRTGRRPRLRNRPIFIPFCGNRLLGHFIRSLGGRIRRRRAMDRRRRPQSKLYGRPGYPRTLSASQAAA